MDKVALVSPIIGEFGWTVFDIQQKVRAFFEENCDHHKIVLANKTLAPFFELADEVIEFEMPVGFLPCGRGADNGRYDHSSFYEKIHTDTLEKFNPDQYLQIPYGNRFGVWKAPSKEKKFYEDRIVDEDKYLTISCRSISRGAMKNWSEENYNELVGMIKREMDLPIYLVGLPKDNYCPNGVLIPETKDVTDHISLLSNSMMHFGSNTGTSHLALLCGCPMFSWGYGNGLKKRMTEDTNPFDTECVFVDGSWNPSVEDIYKEVSDFMKSLNILEIA